MKKILLLALLAFDVTAYTISFDKEFVDEIKPDTLQTFLSYTVVKKSEKEVLEKLTEFSAFVDGYKEVDKKGGNYNINPNYRYENNHRFKDGYRGVINYTISSKHPNDLNAFIYKVQNQKSDKDIDLSISDVRWILGNSQRDGKIDSLRLEAIKWIHTYAHILSSDLNSTCIVKKIVFNQINHNIPQPMMVEVRSVSTAPTPRQDLQKLSLTPHYELECK